MKLIDSLSAPLGLADHKGRHNTGFFSVVLSIAETAAARIPADIKRLGL